MTSPLKLFAVLAAVAPVAGCMEPSESSASADPVKTSKSTLYSCASPVTLPVGLTQKTATMKVAPVFGWDIDRLNRQSVKTALSDVTGLFFRFTCTRGGPSRASHTYDLANAEHACANPRSSTVWRQSSCAFGETNGFVHLLSRQAHVQSGAMRYRLEMQSAGEKFNISATGPEGGHMIRRLMATYLGEV